MTKDLPATPDDVVDRDREWDLLAEFLPDPDPAMRLGIVSGRRRQGERPQAPRARIALLGEAKVTAARRGTGDLERLERIRALLSDQGYDTAATALALYSLHGFYPDLVDLADRRDDLLLVDLATLYGR